jgi:hypothetical protein
MVRSKGKTGSSKTITPGAALETAVAYLRLGESMLNRGSVALAAVWIGKVVFPAGALAKWRKKKTYAGETVGAFLDRLAQVVERGERWLEVRVAGDALEVQGWDWRQDRELFDTFEAALESAALFGAKGSVTRLSRTRSGTASRATFTLARKKLRIDDDDESDDERTEAWEKDEEVQAALATIAPRFEPWLAKHPVTRERIEHSGHAGFIDRTGREVIPPRFSSADDFSEGLAVVYDGWRAHFVDLQGKLLPGFWQGASRFLRGLAPVAIKDTAHWGYIDRSGAVKVAPTFSNAEPFYGPLAMVRKVHAGEGRWMTPGGELVGDPFGWYPYETKCHFVDGRAWTFVTPDRLSETSGAGCIDEQARPAIARRFYNVLSFSEGLAAVVELGETKWGYVDRDGNAVISARFDEAYPFAEGRAVVRTGDVHRLIDRTGAFVGGPFESDYCAKTVSEGMLPFSGKGGLGFLTLDGEVAIAPRFQQSFGFFEGRAAVAVKATRKGAAVGEVAWGHIDQSGEYVVAPTLPWTNRFWDGLAPVQVGPSYGFVDTAGKMVIEPQYKKIQPRFTEGHAWVVLP